MWRTPDGRLHSAALPIDESMLASDVGNALRSSWILDADGLLARLCDVEDHELEAATFLSDGLLSEEGKALPREILSDPMIVAANGDLNLAVVPPEWRLDLVQALIDLLLSWRA